MKIGILTQPLQTNYGGLLQAYALQQVLIGMGHDVLTINRRNNLQYWKFLLKSGRNIFIDNLLFKRKRPWFERKLSPIISQHLDRFIHSNIRITELIENKGKIKKLKKYEFEAYIVGSDQVWRPAYSPGMETFFLDFVGDNNEVKKISYAASFGVDSWVFSPYLTRRCAYLAKQFDAISVREDSAIDLCRKYLNVQAEHVLDPTLLLEKADYLQLIRQEKEDCAEGCLHLMSYVLDKNGVKRELIENIAKKLNLPIFSPMPQKNYFLERSASPEDCVYPSIATWLDGFLKAKFVVTDSFHGTVFSIIFRKPFLAIGNESRGLSRFSSLLTKFELNDRLLFSSQIGNFQKIVEKEINWGKVENVLREERKKSRNFLMRNL